VEERALGSALASGKDLRPVLMKRRGDPVMMSNTSDSRQRASEQAASEDERKPRCGFRIGDRVSVTSDTKPFKGATGIVRAVEQEGWRLAPYFLYRVGYECGELERLSPANT
jgi:transcription antitermination factor NusG